MAKFKCIYLEWEDAVAAADWEEVTEAALFKCKTLGFVVSENDKAICVDIFSIASLAVVIFWLFLYSGYT